MALGKVHTVGGSVKKGEENNAECYTILLFFSVNHKTMDTITETQRAHYRQQDPPGAVFQSLTVPSFLFIGQKKKELLFAEWTWPSLQIVLTSI